MTKIEIYCVTKKLKFLEQLNLNLAGVFINKKFKKYIFQV